MSSFPAALFEGKEIFRKANKPQLVQAVEEFSSKKSNKTVLDSIPPTEPYVLHGGQNMYQTPVFLCRRNTKEKCSFSGPDGRHLKMGPFLQPNFGKLLVMF